MQNISSRIIWVLVYIFLEQYIGIYVICTVGAPSDSVKTLRKYLLHSIGSRTRVPSTVLRSFGFQFECRMTWFMKAEGV